MSYLCAVGSWINRSYQSDIVNLEEYSTTDVAATNADCALLPVGSTEQHGPHAPLGTDTLTAKAVAEEGAASSDSTVIVAPAVPVGIAKEHRAFDGTLWTRPEIFRAYIRDIVNSLASHNCEHVIVVNGHGGNTNALKEVTATIVREDPVYATAFTWFDEIDEHRSQMGHAGSIETALLLETYPQLVSTDRIEAAAADASDQWGEWQGQVNLAVDSDEFTENGVVGDPREASKSLGAELLRLAEESLCELIDAVLHRSAAPRTG